MAVPKSGAFSCNKIYFSNSFLIPCADPEGGGGWGPGVRTPPPLRFVRGGVMCRWFMGRERGSKGCCFARQCCNRVNVWTILITSKFQFPSPISSYTLSLAFMKVHFHVKLLFCLKLPRFFKSEKNSWGGPPDPPHNCNITKTLNNAKTINSNMFWRVENSGKRSYFMNRYCLESCYNG